MSETHGCCAHLKVTWRTKPVGNGAVTGWWQCEICPTHFFPVLATPASTARTDGWVSVANGLPDDDSDVYAAIAWTHSPGVRKYVIHDCSYYEGGTGSGQKIFADCEGEEFEAKEVDFWIYKYRLAEQLPEPAVAAQPGDAPQKEKP